MRGPFRSTAILLALLVAIGGYYFLYESRQPDKSAAPQRDQTVTLWSLKSEDLRSLVITKGDKRLELERPEGDTGRWRIKAPVTAEADAMMMSRVEFDLVDLKADRLVDEQAPDLKQYGLDAPRLQVALGLTNGSARVLLLGRENPVVSGVYARVKDEAKVYLLPSPMVSLWERIVDEPPQAKPTPTATSPAAPRPEATRAATPIGLPTPGLAPPSKPRP